MSDVMDLAVAPLLERLGANPRSSEIIVESARWQAISDSLEPGEVAWVTVPVRVTKPRLRLIQLYATNRNLYIVPLKPTGDFDLSGELPDICIPYDTIFAFDPKSQDLDYEVMASPQRVPEECQLLPLRFGKDPQSLAFIGTVTKLLREHGGAWPAVFRDTIAALAATIRWIVETTGSHSRFVVVERSIAFGRSYWAGWGTTPEAGGAWVYVNDRVDDIDTVEWHPTRAEAKAVFDDFIAAQAEQ